MRVKRHRAGNVRLDKSATLTAPGIDANLLSLFKSVGNFFLRRALDAETGEAETSRASSLVRTRRGWTAGVHVTVST